MTTQVRDLQVLQALLLEKLRSRMSATATDPDAVLQTVERAIAAAGVDEEDAVDIWESFLEIVEKEPEAAASLDESDYVDIIDAIVRSTE